MAPHRFSVPKNKKTNLFRLLFYSYGKQIKFVRSFFGESTACQSTFRFYLTFTTKTILMLWHIKGASFSLGTIHLRSWQISTIFDPYPTIGSFLLLKSVHCKKTVARIWFLSKLWYIQYKSKQKTPKIFTAFTGLNPNENKLNSTGYTITSC